MVQAGHHPGVDDRAQVGRLVNHARHYVVIGHCFNFGRGQPLLLPDDKHDGVLVVDQGIFHPPHGGQVVQGPVLHAQGLVVAGGVVEAVAALREVVQHVVLVQMVAANGVRPGKGEQVVFVYGGHFYFLVYKNKLLNL